ncbi:Sporulation related domain-containing protein [Desulfurobacterium pacificum]|uniref:Sporulation related domain-containing protein n=1 Tax=Desulfurobacterium pacificum TaxID=240166 RepID=A0ABY1NS23_9BACT|nr:SPOR domain-containing protein [Desulfurobacterium pacificum]SMP16806.1 Sporulation related domain-containing protein [Desulfurobacterium pacificum]
MTRVLFLTLFLLCLFVNVSIAVVKHPKPGHRYFTIQFASPTKIETAKKIYKKLKEVPFLRIVKADGHYRVRGGFFSSLKEAEEFINSHEKLKKSPHYITLTVYDPSVVVYGFGSSNSTEEKVSSNATQISALSSEVVKLPIPEENESASLNSTNTTSSNATNNITENTTSNVTATVSENNVVKVENETNVRTNATVFSLSKEQEKEFLPPKVKEKPSVKKRGKKTFYYYYVLLVLGAVFLLLVLFLAKRRKSGGVDFEVYIGKLLEEEDYDKIIEVLVPYLKREPEDTFALKALAEAMEKKGRILETVALYRELAEVLRKKDFVVLAEEFEKKAEKLSEEAFK